LSLKAGSFAFSDVASKILVTISERLLFIVPANQDRPLQILEIPLIANMEYEKSDSTVSGHGTLGGEAELRLHLRNTGFSIFNGFKSAIDVVHLGFESHNDCDAFCHTLVMALQNIPTGVQNLTRGQSDEDIVGGKEPRPKKQSRAVMVDLSQDDIISGDTQSFSYSLQAPGRVSGLHIDMSRSTDSSMSPISPLRPIAEDIIAPLQPGEDEEGLPGTPNVQHGLIQEGTRALQQNPNNAEKAGVGDKIRTQANTKELPTESVATAYPESTSQGKAVRNTAEGPFPQQMQQRDLVETGTGSPVATSTLQNIALDALQHALKSPITATAAPIAQPEDGDRLYTTAQVTPGSPRPPPASAIANPGPKMAAKIDSSRQTASTTLRKPRKQNGGSGRKTNGDLQTSRSASTIPAGEAAVDWDEDLRADEGEEKDQSKPPRTSKAGASRGARSGPTKSAGTKTVPKPPAPRKKGQKKDRVKENKPKAATAQATLATTRPRRTAASVSYGEQSEQEDHSEDSVVETNEPVGLAGSDKSSPNTNNARTHRKTISLDEQNVGGVSDSLIAEPPQPVVAPEPVVEVSSSSKALLTTVNAIIQLDTRHVEGGAPGPDRESTFGQESKTDLGIPELPANAQVEAVEDSHPMDKKQRADAINRARKSFGSGLLDAISETGMQPIQAAHADSTMKKPFGDKSAFVDSVKSALKQGSRKPQARASSSGKRKHVKTPSLSKQGTDSEPQQTLPNDDPQLARARKLSRTSIERSPSYQQAGRGGLTSLPQTTDAASPRAVSDRQKSPTEVLSSPHGKESVSHPRSPPGDHSAQANSTRVTFIGFAPSTVRPELPAKADAPAQIPLSNSHPSITRLEPLVKADSQAPIWSPQSSAATAKPKSTENAGSPAPILPSNSPTLTAKQKPPFETGSPVPGLQPGLKAAITHNNSRKRGPLAESEKPQQAKKARKTDPGPIRDQTNDGWIQNHSLSSQEIDNAPARGPTTKSRISEPTARISSEAEPNEERPIMPWTQYKSKPTRTSGVRMGRPGANASESPSKTTQTKTETPRRHGIGENHPRLTDDHVHRKAQIVGFSAKGPRNQGVMSLSKQENDLEQSSPVPSETGKHLAFKSLRIESTAAGKPATAVPNPFGPFGRLSQRQVNLLSDRGSTDDETHVDEESGEAAVPALAVADVESGKNASQNFKVDVNGSPRRNLRETFREYHQSNDLSLLENSGDVNDNGDTISVFESPESEELESHNSTDFGLESAISDYTATNAEAIAKMKESRGRPSIGVGKLLDGIFPHATERIQTNAFKSWNPSVTAKAPGFSNSFAQFDHGRDPDEKAVYPGLPNETISVDHAEAPFFDIEQLNVSVADEQSGSISSARVRRLRSTTPPTPNHVASEPINSPPSFNTRLGKMIMPPPPRKEAAKPDAVKEYESGLHRRRELSALMDAETTLVNGEASEAETNLLSPQGQQRSSPSSSGDEDGTPMPASQKLPIQVTHNDRRMWNQKVSQTQQTIKEILEQLSQVSALL
jgi:hypothetical protein